MLCKKCGHKTNKPELELSFAARLIEHRLCSVCYFWQCLVWGKKDDRYRYQLVIIDGKRYVLGDKLSNRSLIKGEKFVIRFRDGKQVTTYDLQYQHTIIKKWRKVLPDNARFVSIKNK